MRRLLGAAREEALLDLKFGDPSGACTAAAVEADEAVEQDAGVHPDMAKWVRGLGLGAPKLLVSTAPSTQVASLPVAMAMAMAKNWVVRPEPPACVAQGAIWRSSR